MIEKKTHKIVFEDESYSPIALEEGVGLSQALNSTNSPVLFGCRTGICGTCAVHVLSLNQELLSNPSQEEQETLNVIFPNQANMRLACQIKLNTDIRLKPATQGF